MSFDLRLGPLRSASSPATPASASRVIPAPHCLAGFTANASATSSWVAALIRISDTAANRRPAYPECVHNTPSTANFRKT